MKIRILNLFHDFLNLYGESGNIKAITYYLKSQGIEYEVINHCYNEQIDLNDINLIVCFCGIEENLDKAMAQINKEQLKNYIDNGGFVFFSGNASKILSKQGLNLLDYETKDNKERIVFEGLYSSSLTDHECICFINSYTTIVENKNWIFKLIRTNTPNIGYLKDGYHENNIYITSLIGPVLVRNPWLNEEIMKKLVLSLDNSFRFKTLDYSLEENALNEFKKLYYQQKK